jgi:hypothetical protein
MLDDSPGGEENQSNLYPRNLFDIDESSATLLSNEKARAAVKTKSPQAATAEPLRTRLASFSVSGWN